MGKQLVFGHNYHNR